MLKPWRRSAMRLRGAYRTSPPIGSFECNVWFLTAWLSREWLIILAFFWARLVFELTWRDFFIYMAWSQGPLPQQPLEKQRNWHQRALGADVRTKTLDVSASFRINKAIRANAFISSPPSKGDKIFIPGGVTGDRTIGDRIRSVRIRKVWHCMAKLTTHRPIPGLLGKVQWTSWRGAKGFGQEISRNDRYGMPMDAVFFESSKLCT